MALYKKCNKAGCREYIERHMSYCEQHQNDKASDSYNRDRYKHNKEYVNFYSSSKWRKLRKRALIRDEYCCVSCKREGIIQVGEVADHILPTEFFWDKRLDINNIQVLCKACHNKKTAEDEKKYGKR